MKTELLDYAIENEGSTKIWANLSIRADGIGPFRFYIMPDEWDTTHGWVTFQSGIGCPGDEIDLSSLSTDARSFLLGERHGVEEVHDFEQNVKSSLRQEMKAIMREMSEMLLSTLDHQHEESN